MVMAQDTKIPLLMPEMEDTVSLTKMQCACLLSHMFFGTMVRPPNPKPHPDGGEVADGGDDGGDGGDHNDGRKRGNKKATESLMFPFSSFTAFCSNTKYAPSTTIMHPIITHHHLRCAEQMKCILHYFERIAADGTIITPKPSTSLITIIIMLMSDVIREITPSHQNRKG